MVRLGPYHIRMYINRQIKMKRNLLTIMLLWLLLLPTYSQSESQIKTLINNAASRMQSMTCDFVQTKHLKLLNDKMVSRGKMYYQQRDKLRWEYVSPYQYTFIINGSQVLLKNNGRRDQIDVNQNKVFKSIAQIMMNSVVGKCLSDDKNFRTSIVASGSEYVATLLPQRKDIKSMFEKIILHFDRQKAMVTKVELLEKKGDRTVIELRNIKSNVSIPQSTFAVR